MSKDFQFEPTTAGTNYKIAHAKAVSTMFKPVGRMSAIAKNDEPWRITVKTTC
jgi:hypothetical protein